MPIVSELIRAGENKGVSFGNYELTQKAKVDGFELDGDVYKVKTFNEITKLEKNGLFVYESVPGTAVNNLTLTDKGMSFTAEGNDTTQVTVELAADTEYKVFIDDLQADEMKTNLSGKLVMSLELGQGKVADVRIEKIG